MPVYYHRFEMSTFPYDVDATHEPGAWELHEELYRRMEAGEITCENLPRVFDDGAKVLWNALNDAYRSGRISRDLYETATKLANDIPIMIFFKQDYGVAQYLMRVLFTIMYQTKDSSLIKAVNRYYIYYEFAVDVWPRCPARERYVYKRAKPGELERLVDKGYTIIQLE